MIGIMYTEENPLQFESQGLFLIEGILLNLHTSRTSINLMEQIDESIKEKNLVSGAAAVLSDMYGIVANSASILMYDGEEAYHFAATLGSEVVCGTFQHAQYMKDGDHVKAVVSRRGDVLFVHAILNAKAQEFYMPMNVFSGRDGLFRHCMRVAVGFTVFGWVFMFLLLLVTKFFWMPDVDFNDKVALTIIFFAIPPLFMFPFEYWTYRTMLGAKKSVNYGEAIFEVFGFPKPGKIDLMSQSSLSVGKNGGWYAAWRADQLLKNLGA